MTLTESDLRAVIPRLRDRVFHVTCWDTLAPILNSGGVAPNDGTLASGFPSADNSYYRRRGCVCVFDYRDLDDDVLQDSLMKCAPSTPAFRCDDRLAILFLGDRAIRRLDKTATLSCGEMFVPHVEAGHPGQTDLADIDEILEVTIQRTPNPISTHC